ncbi:hypothetical protein PYW08_013311 [Mythimna loreyi]|uniref:Uncharacterized protein n=1 Tax=Mythimna loreyi TaxID=667449 RepID=A0ACC2QFT0_9NEOP|nr:hypothetical protein PYW08_013311 [Mythimna loreyi]
MEDDIQQEPTGPSFFRHRSPTFSAEEVKALLNIIEKYKTIVFNKSTTSAASHAKEVAWVKIAKLFNRQGFMHKRSAECLKIKWDNMKKKARAISKNLLEPRYNDCEMTNQLVAMMLEAENGTCDVEELVESNEEHEEADNHKESTEGDWDANEDKDSNDSSMDGVKENDRYNNRSMNFSMDECNLLLQCVRQEKNIIFSKTNTAGIHKMKNRAWERISSSYNKLSPQKRSTKVLRTKFGNMRKLVKSNNVKKYFKEFNNKHQKLEDSSSKIKSEPLFECQSSMDADNDSDEDYIEPDNKSNSDDVNASMDPLSTVLNSDLGSSISQVEDKEVVRLKIELLKYKLETAKLKRKRIEDLMQADAAERESKARESSLKLRAARLEAISAEMKLPPAHPALAYPADETRAQHYIHQYHTT